MDTIDRLIVLDTETTGIELSQGHRLIEVGAIEIINRQITDRHYHQYINPENKNVGESIRIHGISDEFLQDKPLFADILQAFLTFIGDSPLIIHNAVFDIGFINNELTLAQAQQTIDDKRLIIDTLELSKKQHLGGQHGLDALCRRYKIDNSKREVHGALLDAQLLAQVYLAMTGGQTSLFASLHPNGESHSAQTHFKPLNKKRAPINIIRASETELAAHHHYFQQS